MFDVFNVIYEVMNFVTWPVIQFFKLPYIIPSLGALCLSSGIYILLGGLASKKWPTTSGRITKSELKESTVSNGDGPNKKGYQVFIRYSYMVGGMAYEGKKIKFYTGTISVDQLEQQREIDRFPVGAQVPVYYNPKNPKSAVLVPGIETYATCVFIIGGLVFIVVGLLYERFGNH